MSELNDNIKQIEETQSRMRRGLTKLQDAIQRSSGWDKVRLIAKIYWLSYLVWQHNRRVRRLKKNVERYYAKAQEAAKW